MINKEKQIKTAPPSAPASATTALKYDRYIWINIIIIIIVYYCSLEKPVDQTFPENTKDKEKCFSHNQDIAVRASDSTQLKSFTA